MTDHPNFDHDRLPEDLVEQAYSDLRAAAKRQLANERPGHTLGATALVHEAYLRLAGPRSVPISERAHFYAAAVEAMRRVLLDHARARHRDKRGGGNIRLSIDDPIGIESVDAGADYEALDDAITKLAQRDPRMARIVQLRFLAGLTVAKVADLLGISERTVKADWAFARAWLTRMLAQSDSRSGG